MKLLIDQELAQSLANYIMSVGTGNRPLGEGYALLSGLSKLEPAPLPASADKDNEAASTAKE